MNINLLGFMAKHSTIGPFDSEPYYEWARDNLKASIKEDPQTPGGSGWRVVRPVFTPDGRIFHFIYDSPNGDLAFIEDRGSYRKDE